MYKSFLFRHCGNWRHWAGFVSVTLVVVGALFGGFVAASACDTTRGGCQQQSALVVAENKSTDLPGMTQQQIPEAPPEDFGGFYKVVAKVTSTTCKKSEGFTRAYQVKQKSGTATITNYLKPPVKTSIATFSASITGNQMDYKGSYSLDKTTHKVSGIWINQAPINGPWSKGTELEEIVADGKTLCTVTRSISARTSGVDALF